MQKSLAILASLFIAGSSYAATTLATNPTILDVVQQKIIVNGKPSEVFNIIQPDGTWGYTGVKGQDFNVIVNNKTNEPLTVHWHGIVDPNNQDGVPYVTQMPILPGQSQHYDFPFVQAGTFWMHSHFALQEQKLMAAPLIIKDPNDPYAGAQDVTMMVQDFTFKDPKVIFDDLRKKLPANSGTVSDSNNKQSSGMQMSNKPDLNDVKFDAYLTNRRTLQDPEVIKVTPGEQVRLRIINGAASSNFWFSTGALKGTVIAFDGENTKPYINNQFELGIGERLDVLVTIPKGEGVYPILAFPEGTKQQTGLILATAGAKIPQYSESTTTIAPPVDDVQMTTLRAANPLRVKKVDQVLRYVLGGKMNGYIWTMNGQAWPKVTPMIIKQGERVEIDFVNQTGMTHPMHMHGHIFELVEVDGKPIKDGVLGDTFLVKPLSTVKVVFDANNPGIWMAHCHVLYHIDGGMMTTFNYAGYPEPEFYKQYLGLKN